MKNNHIIFVSPNGEKFKTIAEEGKTIYQLAKEGGVPIKGNCGGEMACTTCHVSIEESFFEKTECLYNMSDEEADLLETSSSFAFNSRLCCQVVYKNEMSGMCVEIKPESHGEPHH